MPLIETKGAASAQGFGEFAASSGAVTYIEDVFSTYLYTGTGPSNQTITNNIDLSTKGGLVWSKNRTGPYGLSNSLIDTVRGNRYQLYSDLNFAQADLGATVTNQAIASFSTTGYVLGGDQSVGSTNFSSSYTYASWTFRKQPKFFDVVTYTGDGVTGRQISHNLGCVPGAIIIKNTSSSANWAFGLATNLSNWSGTSKTLCLNTTDQASASNTYVNGSINDATSTTFQVVAFSGNQLNVNQSGQTYVAYLFASNAGGFGLTGTDNVISCGSYTGTGALNTITLGYEPQWIMVKNASAAGDNWVIIDNMRGFPAYSTIGGATLFPNSSDAENSGGSERFGPTSTGFQVWGNATLNNASGSTYIYIAIRRGPMKVPTSGTSVFSPSATNNGGTTATVTAGFPVDLTINGLRNTASGPYWTDRLRGTSTNSYRFLRSPLTNAEANNSASGAGFGLDNNVGVVDTNFWTGSGPAFYWNFRRSPSFFDEVCYTGTGSATTFSHNLGVAPELMIVKKRNDFAAWATYSATLGNTQVLFLDKTDSAAVTSTPWNNTSPTATVFTVGTSTTTNASAATYVAYLFATCAGVSKVGSYTGTGATQTISCGFTGGARFVLIKRTDSTGDWYVWDTARGMVSGTDPSLLLNSTAAEANANDVYTTTGGFQIVSTAAGINASGGTYIFLAIA